MAKTEFGFHDSSPIELMHNPSSDTKLHMRDYNKPLRSLKTVAIGPSKGPLIYEEDWTNAYT